MLNLNAMKEFDDMIYKEKMLKPSRVKVSGEKKKRKPDYAEERKRKREGCF